MADYNKARLCIQNNPGIFDGLKVETAREFEAWLPDNMHIVNAFGKAALHLKRNVHREYYSAYCIREKIRWDSMLSEVGTEYKISNNMTPFVSRLVMALCPVELKGMFRTKFNGED
jgi:hypothetical protein